MSGDGKELAPRGETHPTASTTGITLRKPEEKKIAPVRRVLPDELVPQVEGWIVLQGRNAYAANSLRALLSDWSHFARWAWESGQLPYITLAAPGDLIVYFDDHDHLAKATLNRRHASLVRLYRVLGHPDNPAEHEHLTAHLKAMRREHRHGEGRGQAAALRWKDIERIIDALDPDNSLRDARARLALGLCYDGMLRRGEVARLKVVDLHPIDEGNGSQLGDDNASITVRRSKANQEGDPEALHCAQLTASWARDWIERIGLGPEDYLICGIEDEGSPSGRHDTPVPDSEIAAIFKEAARQAGFAAEIVTKISGHSPRVGMTQDLVAEGMPLVDIMFVGRWKSPEMVFRYAKALGTRYHVTAELSGRQGRGQKVERPTPRKGGVIKPREGDSS